MGRRTCGGGGRRSASEILRRRIESCESGYSTVEELVDSLRSNYPDYRRTKCQPFTRLVQQTLDAAGKITNKKNPKRGHNAEDRLKHLKNEHVKRRMHNDHDRPSTSPSSSSSSEEEEGSVSTSEDAVYGEKVEPEFDLMKLRLRDAYSESKNTKPETEERNIEFEATPSRKINLASGEVEMKKEVSVKGYIGSSGEELKGKEGPRFQDLGGMENVLEELKMEVIVPLYHPQLPQWLGVRPMAGILLHGPPGCGKTKLAHAIANETGVPFYKISATEVVSGVSGMDLFSYNCV